MRAEFTGLYSKGPRYTPITPTAAIAVFTHYTQYRADWLAIVNDDESPLTYLLR